MPKKLKSDEKSKERGKADFNKALLKLPNEKLTSSW